MIAHLLAADGFIVTNKNLIRKLGLQEAALIGELCSEFNYWEARGELRDGWFFSTVDNVERATGIKRTTQTTILNRLCGMGIVKVSKSGMPPKRYVKIQWDKLEEVLDRGDSGEPINQIPVGVQPNSGSTLNQIPVDNNKNNNKNKNNKFSYENVLEICEKNKLTGRNDTSEQLAKWFWEVSNTGDGTLNYKGAAIRNYGGLVSVLRCIDVNGKRLRDMHGTKSARPDEAYF